MPPATHKPDNGTGLFLKSFSHFESPSKPAWLLPLRKAGMARFAELGFPTTHDEDWRFTNVAPLAKLPFKPMFEPAADATAKSALENYIFAHVPGPRLVFVNGHYSATLSSIGKLPAGAKVSSLAVALTSDSVFIEKQLGRCALTDDNAFAALNQAFFLDGGFVHVPAGVLIVEPIQFIFVSTAKQSGETIQPRNLIVAGADSKATVIESYISADTTAYFTNVVTEIVAGDNAALEYVKFQDESADAFHLATIAAELGRASKSGLSSRAVRIPTTIASTRPLRTCTRWRDSVELIH